MPDSQTAAPEQGASKRTAILQAGAGIFLRLGYGPATMDQIAADAGVAKQTLYKHFGSKEGLFREIVSELANELTAPLGAGNPTDEDPRLAMTALAERYLRLLLKPANLAMHRAVVAEAPRFPELARMLYAAGPATAVTRLESYLRMQSAVGRLDIGDAKIAAEQFFGMLNGHSQLRALLQVEERAGSEHSRRMIDYAVKTFLTAHGYEEKTKTPQRGVARETTR